MTAPAVTLDIKPPSATITIARRERRNAINPEVVDGIREALDRAVENEDVKVSVLTGEGDEAFCAGGDLGGMTNEGPVRLQQRRGELGDLFKEMRACPLPIVARVNGHALAGGFGLMLACDLVVAVEDAQLGTPEINLGLWPFMISAVIRRDVPRKLALELMLTGKRLDASEAARWGIVNRVVPRAKLDLAVDDLVTELSSKSSLILGLGKSSFYGAEDMAFADALAYLSGMLTLCLESDDTVEGVTAFLQKRAPEWKNR